MSSPIDISIAEWLPFFIQVWELYTAIPIFTIIIFAGVGVFAISVLMQGSVTSDK